MHRIIEIILQPLSRYFDITHGHDQNVSSLDFENSGLRIIYRDVFLEKLLSEFAWSPNQKYRDQ